MSFDAAKLGEQMADEWLARRGQSVLHADAEVQKLRALIERILSFSDFTAAQQEQFRREAGLM